ERHRVVKARDEVVRDLHALIERRRLRVADALLLVALHLPLVQRMRLLDVQRHEPHAIPVALPDPVHALDRAAERGSGEAAEDEDRRLLAELLGQLDRGLAVERDERDVGRTVADLERAFLPLVVAQHPDQVLRSADHVGHAADREKDDGADAQEDPLQNAPRLLAHFAAPLSFLGNRAFGILTSTVYSGSTSSTIGAFAFCETNS